MRGLLQAMRRGDFFLPRQLKAAQAVLGPYGKEVQLIDWLVACPLLCSLMLNPSQLLPVPSPPQPPPDAARK